MVANMQRYVIHAATSTSLIARSSPLDYNSPVAETPGGRTIVRDSPTSTAAASEAESAMSTSAVTQRQGICSLVDSSRDTVPAWIAHKANRAHLFAREGHINDPLSTWIQAAASVAAV